MAYCTNCRNYIYSHERFCSKCGTPARHIGATTQHRRDYDLGDLVGDVASTVVTVAVIDTVGDVLGSLFD
jgi:predicted amidophosphoribosyltransferase